MGDLRQCGHDSVLPNIIYDFNKRHFIAHVHFIQFFHYVYISVYVYVLYELFFSWTMSCAWFLM